MNYCQELGGATYAQDQTKKYTNEEWQFLTREEKRQAILDFREPDFIHQNPKYIPDRELKGEL